MDFVLSIEPHGRLILPEGNNSLNLAHMSVLDITQYVLQTVLVHSKVAASCMSFDAVMNISKNFQDYAALVCTKPCAVFIARSRLNDDLHDCLRYVTFWKDIKKSIFNRLKNNN
jgi:hypothetical protein